MNVYAALVILVCPAAGCRKQTDSHNAERNADTRKFIAVVGAGKKDELWPVLRGAALRCGQEFGRTPVRAFAPDHISQNAQSELIEDLCGPDLRGLCVQPVDSKVIAPLLERVRTSGVLVVTLFTPAPTSTPLHHCGPYEPHVGKAMAQALAEALGDGGNIAVLRTGSARPGLADRERGFFNELEHRAGLSVLQTLTYDGSTAQASQVIRDFSERYPHLQGFAVIDEINFADLPAPENPLVPNTCKLVGCGPYPRAWPYLRDGRVHALVATEYERVVLKAVQWCLLAADGVQVEVQTYETGVQTVWAGNLDSWTRQWDRWTQVSPTQP